MTQLNPYLGFGGNAREAMEFYKECLGGDLEIMTFGDSQMGDQTPAEQKNNVMHSMLKTGGMVLMASDMMDPGDIVVGNNISICIVGDSKEAIEGYFAKLSEGGKVGHELKEEFFGTYGDLTDKFGVNWMFQADSKAKE